jgi:hypothetical protein
MTATTTTAGSLSAGDTVIGTDGFLYRVTSVVRSARTVAVTVEAVEAAMMVCPPLPTTFRLGVNRMVNVPAA